MSGARPSATGSREPGLLHVPALTGFDPARGEQFIWSRLRLAIERVGVSIARIDNDLGYQGSGHILTSDDVRISDVSLLMSAAGALLASVDRSPKGEKPQALSAEHESAVGAAETPNPSSSAQDPS